MKGYLILGIKLLTLLILLIVIDRGYGILGNYLNAKAIKANPDHLRVKVEHAISAINDDMVIIGASEPVHNYIPSTMQDSLGISVYNAGRDGSFFLFQNVMVRLLAKKNPPKYLLWDIDEVWLESNIDESDEYQNVRLLYSFYDSDEFCKSIINEKSKWESLFMHSYMYRYNSSLLEYLQVFLQKNEEHNKGYIPLPTTGYKYPQKKKTSLSEKQLDLYRVAVLRETLDICKKQGIKVLMVSSPMYQDTGVFEKKCYKELVRIFKENQVGYLNYYSVYPFNNDSTFFKDSYHMNANGAEAFMKVLLPDLKNEIYND